MIQKHGHLPLLLYIWYFVPVGDFEGVHAAEADEATEAGGVGQEGREGEGATLGEATDPDFRGVMEGGGLRREVARD